MTATSRASEITKAIIFTACFVLVNGYRLGVDGGNAAFLGVIEAMSGESQLWEDFGVQSYLPYHPAFNYLMASASSIAGIPAAFFAGYILSGLLFYFSISALVRRVCESDGAVTIALGLVLVWGSSGVEANSFWYSGQFAPYLASWPFALFAISAALDGKPIATGILLGASGALHPQQGADVALVLYSSVLLTRRMSLGAIVASGALFTLLAFPAWYAAYSIAAGDLPGTAELLEQASFRSPHHFDIQPRKLLGVSIAVAVLAGSFSWIVSAGRTLLARDSWCLLVVLALITEIAASFHYLAFYSLGFGEVVLLQLPRVTPIAQLTALTACAALADSALRKGTRSSIGVAALFSLFAGPIWLATGYFSRPELLFCAASAAFVCTDRARAAGRDPFRAFAFCLLVLIAAKGIFVSISYEHYFVYDPREIEGDPWVDVSAWAGANTPESSLFVTPPSEEGFSFYSRRSAIADFVANPHLHSHIAEWRKRIADLSGGELPACTGFACLAELERAYRRLSEEQLVGLGSEYGASYAIATSGAYSLRTLYDNGSYAVYDLRTRS